VRTIEKTIRLELTPEEYNDRVAPDFPRVVMNCLGDERIFGLECQNKRFRYEFDANYNLYYIMLKFKRE
jgi:hypothetical protein